ncbi:hypothetical protein [Frankia sp. AgB32]|uniref:hypothetical protein n=1 Tax=Frankia sp. AgB32 TaxID=631119 RepID=UPI00200D181B|nr:hypothetical protein [Frankia sp. AgB32]MCK9893978.1 hypothetical protein [Frankia sp. AgB32]
MLWWAVKLRRFEIGEFDDEAFTSRQLDLDDPIPGLEHLPRSSIGRAETTSPDGERPRWRTWRRRR